MEAEGGELRSYGEAGQKHEVRRNAEEQQNADDDGGSNRRDYEQRDRGEQRT